MSTHSSENKFICCHGKMMLSKADLDSTRLSEYVGRRVAIFFSLYSGNGFINLQAEKNFSIKLRHCPWILHFGPCCFRCCLSHETSRIWMNNWEFRKSQSVKTFRKYHNIFMILSGPLALKSNFKFFLWLFMIFKNKFSLSRRYTCVLMLLRRVYFIREGNS